MFISLDYLSDLARYETEKPYEVFMQRIPEGLPKTNCEYTRHEGISISDARGSEKAFSIEDSGFCFLQADSFPIPPAEAFEASESRDVVIRYIQDCVSFTLKHVQAQRALCFDWRVSGSCIKVLDLAEY